MNSNVDIEALSPENVLHLIRVIEPSNPIRVRGRVTKLNIYPSVCYGTLESLNGDGAITFKCPLDSAPKMEQQIAIFEGVLTAKPFSIKQKGLDVILSGRCLGLIDMPIEPVAITQLKTRTSSKVRLKRFIDEVGLSGIGIIGTSVGINDIRAQSGVNDSNFSFVFEMPFYDPAKLIAKVVEKNPKAIIFSRGGDDESIRLWDNPDFVNQLINLGIPFYTAIGHAHRLTVADQYADETFETPSALGTSIRSIINEIETHRASVVRLTTLNKSLTENSILLSKNIELLKYKFKLLCGFSVAVLLLLVSVFLFFARH